MYHQQRVDLNKVPENKRKIGIRKSMYAPGYVSVSVDKDKGIFRKLSPANVCEWKATFAKAFPSARDIIQNYKCVDQGGEGACSLVGFINCAQLSGKNISVARKTWKRLWGGRESMQDIGEMLDVFSARLKFQPFQYIPINGTEEIYYNKTHWNPSGCQSHFKISKTEYATSPFVWENGYLIERLLDQQKPVLINALEHTRTCIAYNETHLLFADNWSPRTKFYSKDKADIKGKITTGTRNGEKVECAPIESFAASFSCVNKWFIYSYMRDILYFDLAKTSAKASSKASKTTGESKTSGRRTSEQITGIAPIDAVLGFVGSLLEAPEEIREVDRLPKSKEDFERNGLTKIGQKYKSRRGRKVYTVTKKDLRVIPVFKQFTDMNI
jgi:hypothetical protein